MMPQTIYVTADRGALLVKLPMQGKHKFAPLSATEFFDEDMLTPRLTFVRIQYVGSGRADP